MDLEFAILIAVVVVALAFDYTNGFHDAANAIATSVSTRALTPRIALVLAAVMNFVGALLGQKVAHTVSDVIDTSGFPVNHGLTIVMCGLLGRHRLEPDHVVAGAAVLVDPRADRRPGRLGPRRGCARALEHRRRQGAHPDGGSRPSSGSAWRSC